MPDASHELTELEKKLADASARFERMPGAMWLASTAIIESATRLGEALPSALSERRDELLVRARRARDDAGPRSSENDVSAITMWVELAEKRAVIERAVKAALAEVDAHRLAHPELGEVPASRNAVERALGEREKDVAAREARLAVALDASEAGNIGGGNTGAGTPDTELVARSAAARARLAAGGGRARSAAAAVMSALTLSLVLFPAPAPVRILALALTLAAYVVRARSRAARAHDLAEVHAIRLRDEARLPSTKEDHARLITAARALGALDAFGATEDGRTLDDRETKLVTLAPWIRELVSGFTADEASRFS